MELSWLTKLKIAATAAIGVVLIGILAWPLVEPADPFGAVLAGTISLVGVITLAILALLVGFLGYFISWPYGRQIGVLAVPAGLAVWALRTGNIANLIQQNPALAQRQALFQTFMWEPIFWLAIVANGFFGVLLANKAQPSETRPDKIEPAENESKSNSKPNIYLTAAIALVVSGFIALICLRIFAQNVKDIDSQLGFVVTQPTIGQIVFAVLISFTIAAFVVKKFFDADYIWPVIASSLITAFVSSIYVKENILQQLEQQWPAVIFAEPITSILPIQMVVFGTFGSICGYWLAVRYNYWRHHETDTQIT